MLYKWTVRFKYDIDTPARITTEGDDHGYQGIVSMAGSMELGGERLTKVDATVSKVTRATKHENTKSDYEP